MSQKVEKQLVESAKAFGPYKGKAGNFYNHILVVAGERYTLPFQRSGNPSVGNGDLVSFDYSIKEYVSKDGAPGQTNNIDGKTFQVEKATGLKPRRADTFTSNAVGMQVGNALNVASNLLGEGYNDPKKLEATAKEVLQISERLKFYVEGGDLAKDIG